MVDARLYVEGGGDAKDLRSECRRAFQQLLVKAGLGGRMPRIVACGSRQQTLDDFAMAMRDREGGAGCLVLVDSEGPVNAASSWTHLERQVAGAWARPAGVAEEQGHLMVQCMESWLLADRQALAKFFGQGFGDKALPGNPNIEEVSKRDLFAGLAAASKRSKNGAYRKGAHSFQLLASLDVAKVTEASRWARRFFDTMKTWPHLAVR